MHVRGTSKMFNEAVNNGNKLMVDGDEGSILEDTADVNTVINAPNVSIPIPETNKEPMDVIFDEELIKDGSSKWKLTLCGYFVGHKISINDLRYNIRRMWSRHGFKEVTENDYGMFFFRFHNERGLNYVVENGPWMVNNKPLVVQRWDINMSIDKTEPHKLPLKVKYDWTPPLCSDCGMFRHCKEKRPKTPKDSIACDTDNDGTTNAKESTDDGFTKVKNKRFEKHNVVKKQNYKPDTQSKKNVLNGGGANNQKYKPKVATNDKSNVMEKDVGSNKFPVLDEYGEGELQKMEGMINRDQFDVFISMRKLPTSEEMSGWLHDMICYFKKRWESLIDKNVNVQPQYEGNKNSSEEMDDFYNVSANSSALALSLLYQYGVENCSENQFISFMSFVYAANSGAEIRELWKDLNRHKCERKEESIILKKYMDVVADEDKLLYQKSKIKWLSYGDKNNVFFHKVLKGMYQRNRIHFIPNEGVIVVCFLSKKLPDMEANFMVREVTDKEIEVFIIGDNKALGPNGFTTKFFKEAWNIVRKDVCNIVKELFSTGKLLGEMNATLISLVPKLATPLKVSDFRKIAVAMWFINA
ncbi:RNA-directed DNA polymerase, eukaryota, reverse transcriptase zinc-binding domain protein [Tanacetum coccineum]|uniref:RNA-directed DNA polymerase, eukaryota, reverse transcriptase zinc-binding domain protein n=1 Tax=Tanacetum coccineum TaxID=301880 RepID=A0ABQ5A9P5_9ASTR